MPSQPGALGLIIALLLSANAAAQSPWPTESPAHYSPMPQRAPYDASTSLAETPSSTQLAPVQPPERYGTVTPASYHEPVTAAGATSHDVSAPGEAAGESLPLPDRGTRTPLALPGRSNSTGPSTDRGGMPATVTVVASLGIVLGLFLLVAWGMRRATPKGLTMLPGEVFESLGRAPLANRQQVHLLRCGSKLLLVSVTTAGTETLTEITDPMEVDRLAGLCRQSHPNSATAVFREVFQQFTQKHQSAAVMPPGGRDELDLGSARPIGRGLEGRDV